MIRVDAWWLAVQPLDMRVGTEAALARVVQVFGQAHPHHAYLFANRRANRMKVLLEASRFTGSPFHEAGLGSHARDEMMGLIWETPVSAYSAAKEDRYVPVGTDKRHPDC